MLNLKRKREYSGLLFVSPWFVGFSMLFLAPLVQSFLFSLSRIEVVGGGFFLNPVGWANYRHILFVHPSYVRTVFESLFRTISSVPLILIFSVFAASLVRKPFAGRTVARAVLFFPVIIGSGVVLRLQAQDWMRELMQNTAEGSGVPIGMSSAMLQETLIEAGLGEALVSALFSAVNRVHEIVGRSGVQILLALAALQSIPTSFYEAAKMEGATSWELYWKVTFPMISPVLLASAVYSIVDSFTAFDNETMLMVRNTAFGQSQFGQSAAMAWVYFVMIAVTVAILFRLVARSIVYQE